MIDGNIGLFLLQNGDIIIAQNKEIRFIKRNGKWMNFSRYTFVQRLKDTIEAYLNLENMERLLKNIYATSIDVSLAHTGGIIAVVDNENSIDGIISKIDNLKLGIDDNIEEKLFNNEFNDKYNCLEKNDECIEPTTILTNDEIDKLCNENTDLALIKKDIVKRLTKRYYLVGLIKNVLFKISADISTKLEKNMI